MKNQIQKRRLGRTNLQVTELGFGAMDTPQVPEGKDTLLSALSLGINFIDTSRIYEGSEFFLGTKTCDDNPNSKELRARARAV